MPLKTQQTEAIWNALLNHYIYTFSAPKKILTDRGQNFIPSLMQQYEDAFKIKHIETTFFHKQRYQRDQKRKVIKPQSVFKEGGSVLVHNDHKKHKLDMEWLGPYMIDKPCTPFYLIQDKKIHGNCLKPYFAGRHSSLSEWYPRK